MFNIFASVLAVSATFAGIVTATPAPGLGARGVHTSKLAPRASGEFTYYDPGQGACGQTHTSADYVVALAAADFDPSTPNGNPNNNPLCGRRLRAHYNGKSVDVAVADRCPSCSSGDLDLSPVAFDVLENRAVGRIQGTWEYI